MNRFQEQLDNYITGHYGEDQFKEERNIPEDNLVCCDFGECEDCKGCNGKCHKTTEE